MTVTTTVPALCTYITSDAATTNFGTTNYMAVGASASTGANGRTLIKDAFTDIPSSAIIDSVVLTLTCAADYSTNARTLSVYRVLRDWVETQATYNIYKTGNNWGTSGCSNTTTDRESANSGTATQAAAYSAGDTLAITIDAAKTQEMTSGAFTNNGWLLQVATESSDAIAWASEDHATAGWRPSLAITWHVNATPADVACATSIENVVLGVESNIEPDACDCTSSIENVVIEAIAGTVDLVPANADCASSIEEPTLVAIADLTVTDVAFTSSIEEVTIVVVVALTVADVDNISSIDALTIATFADLTVDDASCATTIDEPAFSLVVTLVIADSTCATSIEVPTLVALATLTVADVSSATSIGTVVLAVTSHIVLEDVACASSIENVVLVITKNLVIQDATILSTIDNVSITQVHVLVVADCAVASAIENVVLWSYGFVKPYAQPKTVIVTGEAQQTTVKDNHDNLYSVNVSSSDQTVESSVVSLSSSKYKITASSTKV